MRLFECQNCGQPLYFENTSATVAGCGSVICRRASHRHRAGGDRRRTLARARRAGTAATVYAPMRSMTSAIGWSPPNSRRALRSLPPQPHHSRSFAPDNLAHWRKIEPAKHRLFYTLLRLRLPLATKTGGPRRPRVRFPVGAARRSHGDAGHDRPSTAASITINLAEADDVERERQRQSDGGALPHAARPFPPRDRTLLLGPAGRGLAAASTTSGGCSATSARTMRGAAAPLRARRRRDWQEHFVTAYASAHPWEDFAETWAHYLHMVDTLETAGAFGAAAACRRWPSGRPRHRRRLRSVSPPTSARSSTPGCR